MSNFQPGTKLRHGRYELLSYLSRGAFIEAWEARDRNGTPVIVLRAKEQINPHIRQDQENRLRRTGRLLKKLRGIPYLYQLLAESDDDIPFYYQIVEDARYAGVDSDQQPRQILDLLFREMQPAPFEIIEIIEQVAHLLSLMHARNVIWNDVAPQNIFWGRGEVQPKLKAVDLGNGRDLKDKSIFSWGGSKTEDVRQAGEMIRRALLPYFDNRLGVWEDLTQLGAKAERGEISDGFAFYELVKLIKKRVEEFLFKRLGEVTQLIKKGELDHIEQAVAILDELELVAPGHPLVQKRRQEAKQEEYAIYRERSWQRVEQALGANDPDEALRAVEEALKAGVVLADLELEREVLLAYAMKENPSITWPLPQPAEEPESWWEKVSAAVPVWENASLASLRVLAHALREIRLQSLQLRLVYLKLLLPPENGLQLQQWQEILYKRSWTFASLRSRAAAYEQIANVVQSFKPLSKLPDRDSGGQEIVVYVHEWLVNTRSTARYANRLSQYFMMAADSRDEGEYGAVDQALARVMQREIGVANDLDLLSQQAVKIAELLDLAHHAFADPARDFMSALVMLRDAIEQAYRLDADQPILQYWWKKIEEKHFELEPIWQKVQQLDPAGQLRLVEQLLMPLTEEDPMLAAPLLGRSAPQWLNAYRQHLRSYILDPQAKQQLVRGVEAFKRGNYDSAQMALLRAKSVQNNEHQAISQLRLLVDSLEMLTTGTVSTPKIKQQLDEARARFQISEVEGLAEAYKLTYALVTICEQALLGNWPALVEQVEQWWASDYQSELWASLEACATAWRAVERKHWRAASVAMQQISPTAPRWAVRLDERLNSITTRLDRIAEKSHQVVREHMLRSLSAQELYQVEQVQVAWLVEALAQAAHQVQQVQQAVMPVLLNCPAQPVPEQATYLNWVKPLLSLTETATSYWPEWKSQEPAYTWLAQFERIYQHLQKEDELAALTAIRTYQQENEAGWLQDPYWPFYEAFLLRNRLMRGEYEAAREAIRTLSQQYARLPQQDNAVTLRLSTLDKALREMVARFESLKSHQKEMLKNENLEFRDWLTKIHVDQWHRVLKKNVQLEQSCWPAWAGQTAANGWLEQLQRVQTYVSQEAWDNVAEALLPAPQQPADGPLQLYYDKVRVWVVKKQLLESKSWHEASEKLAVARDRLGYNNTLWVLWFLMKHTQPAEREEIPESWHRFLPHIYQILYEIAQKVKQINKEVKNTTSVTLSSDWRTFLEEALKLERQIWRPSSKASGSISLLQGWLNRFDEVSESIATGTVESLSDRWAQQQAKRERDVREAKSPLQQRVARQALQRAYRLWIDDPFLPFYERLFALVAKKKIIAWPTEQVSVDLPVTREQTRIFINPTSSRYVLPSNQLANLGDRDRARSRSREANSAQTAQKPADRGPLTKREVSAAAQRAIYAKRTSQSSTQKAPTVSPTSQPQKPAKRSQDRVRKPAIQKEKKKQPNKSGAVPAPKKPPKKESGAGSAQKRPPKKESGAGSAQKEQLSDKQKKESGAGSAQKEQLSDQSATQAKEKANATPSFSYRPDYPNKEPNKEVKKLFSVPQTLKVWMGTLLVIAFLGVACAISSLFSNRIAENQIGTSNEEAIEASVETQKNKTTTVVTPEQKVTTPPVSPTSRAEGSLSELRVCEMQELANIPADFRAAGELQILWHPPIRMRVGFDNETPGNLSPWLDEVDGWNGLLNDRVVSVAFTSRAYSEPQKVFMATNVSYGLKFVVGENDEEGRFYFQTSSTNPEIIESAILEYKEERISVDNLSGQKVSEEGRLKVEYRQNEIVFSVNNEPLDTRVPIRSEVVPRIGFWIDAPDPGQLLLEVTGLEVCVGQ